MTDKELKVHALSCTSHMATAPEGEIKELYDRIVGLDIRLVRSQEIDFFIQLGWIMSIEVGGISISEELMDKVLSEYDRHLAEMEKVQNDD